MDEIQIIAMVNMSAGNESVGDMWTETAIFNISQSLLDIYRWAEKVTKSHSIENVKSNIKLSIAQNKTI